MLVADYSTVQTALSEGTDPAMLCTTCPWDRYCVQPPVMTKSEVDRQMDDATRKAEAEADQAARAGRPAPMPTGMLLTALVVGAKDTSSQVCPVFAARLRSAGGRRIADSLKTVMQGWEDSQ